MPSSQEAVRELLLDGVDDWVSLDRIIWAARQVSESSSADFGDEFRDLLDTLVRGGLVVPGELGDSGFERWGGEPGELIARVIEQAQEFGWAPQGAGCWFANTELGDRTAG
ncbi:hypothetical protein [Lentzea sp. NBRC 102530]|uniref:hypothetical protein n=1 Tax=Lentzea sp. NBRC 102530 TaxID=3032201 RepID=UPI0024A26D54|nr:hypothetical protein [Lentzea sp. NBRC 102530]GLY50590.1 hypothetical protein Lesp01_42460 [Lentzea sp. NBRC 102530]